MILILGNELKETETMLNALHKSGCKEFVVVRPHPYQEPRRNASKYRRLLKNLGLNGVVDNKADYAGVVAEANLIMSVVASVLMQVPSKALWCDIAGKNDRSWLWKKREKNICVGRSEEEIACLIKKRFSLD